LNVLIIYGSSREEGNTEWLTEKVAEGLTCTRVYLRNTNIRPIVDQRHAPGGFTPVDDDHDQIMQQMLAHDAVIFATPLYWYGMSGPMKDFIDRWSQSLRDERLGFKEQIRGRNAYVVVTGGPDARLKGLPLIQQFGHIFDFVGMKFVAYIIANGGKPGQVQEDERAMLEAGWLNRFLHRQSEG